MSGETERNISGWTVDTLKELMIHEITGLHSLMDERDARYATERDASKAAAEKLEASQKHTNEAQNEWRKTVQDFKDATVSRETHDQAIARVDERATRNAEDIQKIETIMAGGTGGQIALVQRRNQMNWIIGICVTIGGLMIMATLSLLGLVATLVYFLVGKH